MVVCGQCVAIASKPINLFNSEQDLTDSLHFDQTEDTLSFSKSVSQRF